MKSLFVNVFSFIVCDVILQEQKDKHVNETHQLPCLKRKVVHSALMSSSFCPHLIFKFGDLIEFSVLKD